MCDIKSKKYVSNCENDNIIHLFYDLFPKIKKSKKLISCAWKGHITFQLINKSDNHEEYIGFHAKEGDIILHSDGNGTVEIIKLLIEALSQNPINIIR